MVKVQLLPRASRPALLAQWLKKTQKNKKQKKQTALKQETGFKSGVGEER